jgi:hypothetical protein
MSTLAIEYCSSCNEPLSPSESSNRLSCNSCGANYHNLPKPCGGSGCVNGGCLPFSLYQFVQPFDHTTGRVRFSKAELEGSVRTNVAMAKVKVDRNESAREAGIPSQIGMDALGEEEQSTEERSLLDLLNSNGLMRGIDEEDFEKTEEDNTDRRCDACKKAKRHQPGSGFTNACKSINQDTKKDPACEHIATTLTAMCPVCTELYHSNLRTEEFQDLSTQSRSALRCGGIDGNPGHAAYPGSKSDNYDGCLSTLRSNKTDENGNTQKTYFKGQHYKNSDMICQMTEECTNHGTFRNSTAGLGCWNCIQNDGGPYGSKYHIQCKAFRNIGGENIECGKFHHNGANSYCNQHSTSQLRALNPVVYSAGKLQSLLTVDTITPLMYLNEKKRIDNSFNNVDVNRVIELTAADVKKMVDPITAGKLLIQLRIDIVTLVPKDDQASLEIVELSAGQSYGDAGQGFNAGANGGNGGSKSGSSGSGSSGGLCHPCTCQPPCLSRRDVLCDTQRCLSPGSSFGGDGGGEQRMQCLMVGSTRNVSNKILGRMNLYQQKIY